MPDIRKQTSKINRRVLDELVESSDVTSLRFDESQVVTHTVSLLEEEGGARADQFTRRHDGYSVPEQISLVHVVSCQEDSPVFLGREVPCDYNYNFNR